ncbi:MAG TPA: carboxypeptidase regulatory-like domain-containing protein [Vicinamibacteria bacterium]|nr:carboxypeptidase regulatory-like domain-containing protein [Vicinamibacteria bacterium]
MPLWCALAGVLAACPALADGQEPAAARPAASCEVRGTIRSAGAPLPGVVVTLAPEGRADVVATSSALDGSFAFRVPAAGAFTLGASLTGFAPLTREVVLAPGACRATVELEMVLRSREARPGGAPPNGAPRSGRGGFGEGRFQGVDVAADAAGEALGEAPDAAAQALLPPGFSADAPTESVALAGSGRQVQTLDALLFHDRLQWLDEAGGDLDALARRVAQAGIDGPPGGRGFPGGGPGGFGPGGFGPGGPRGEGFGGFNRSNRLQGSVFYNAAGSPFDARPFSLNGQPTEKAQYFQNRYGATLGGPVKIPGLYDGTSRTSFNLSYSGSRTRNPYDAYSTVPTEAERDGDFSDLDRTIDDPLSGEPFPGNVIPADRIDPAARALLDFIPLPNQTGTTQNYHYVTATSSSSDQVTLRLNHALGAAPARPGGAGRGAQGRRGTGRRRPSVTAAVTYRHASAQDTPTFPTVGGETRVSSWDVPVSISLPTGRVFHQIRFDYNRNQSTGQNLFAGVRDVAGEAGVLGASSDPFDWGVPNLTFSSFTSLRDRNPSSRLDQRLSVSEVATRSWGSHNLRFGGGFRTQKLDSDTDTNPRGTFVFTGFYTSAVSGGATVPGSGLDFADFLLGRAQQASVQYGPGHIELRGDAWNLFVQDDWRLHSNLTLNLGLRYECVSPLVEANDHLVNLDVPPDFSAAVPVLAGQSGAFTGPFPKSLVNADWNNLAPRIGLAWKAKPSLSVRGGFGINYGLGVYSGIAQHLAGQPPFAESKTLLGTVEAALPLQDGLTQPGAATTNSYGIDKSYQLPAVMIWNLDLQRQFAGDLMVDVGYTGTRGYDLDLQRAPNRGPTGLRIPDVAPFIWESSGATSIMHSGTLRVRRRLTHGFGFGVAYTYGKSIDDASSIGGGAAVVAQNDQDLAAERGLSSFDRRHNLAADWLLELPVGPGRKWLREGALASLLGGWVWSGTASLQSGTPFTARVLGDYADVARGVNGTLRANVTGEAVELPDPTVARWFDTAAFTLPPTGSFGDAGRNTVIGPGTFLVNMGLIKNVDLGRPRTLSIRVQANNVFNTPPLVGIDTVVNSPTFGQVVQVGSMRSIQIQTRFRF